MNNRINFDEEGKEQINIRVNIINIIVYLIGIVLIVQLFNLQVVHGESYREQSNTRLSRASVIKAARGSILDRSGNELAGVKTESDIEIYKYINIETGIPFLLRCRNGILFYLRKNRIILFGTGEYK